MGRPRVQGKSNADYAINDRAWQALVFGRYKAPTNRKPLTPLQQVIWESLEQGYSRPEISAYMSMPSGNLDTHLASMRTKGWAC